MNYLVAVCLAFLLTLGPASRAAGQERVPVVFGPGAGPLVDSARYTLIPGSDGERSAVVDQSPDSSLRLGYPDSTLVPGSPPLPGKSTANRLRDDRLPLSADTNGLGRPAFFEFRFGASMGMTLIDFSSLEDVNSAGKSFSLPLTLYLQIPLSTMPSLTLAAGWGYTVAINSQGQMETFTAAVIYRSLSNGWFRMILGAGGGYLAYDSDVTYIVRMRQAYPLILGGFNIIPDVLDAVLICPIAGELKTTFHDKSYSMRPATISMNLLVTF